MGSRNGKEPLRVVVLDDDVDVAQAICEVLGLARHVARPVHDLSTAWRAIRDDRLPDVLVADYHIGVVNSGLLLAAVRHRFPCVRRVLMSASSAREWRHLVERGLVHAALSKPFVPVELIQLVEATSLDLELDG